jgi:hypothetical protein
MAVANGAAGLLIAPRDATAAVRAVERLAGDVELRERLTAAGLEHVADETMERQLDRIVRFLADAVAERPAIARAA